MNAEPPGDCPGCGAPQPAVPDQGARLGRRAFLERLSVGLVAACAAIVGVPIIGFVVAPLFKRPPETWRTVGRTGDFEVGKTVSVTFEDSSPLPWAGVTARAAAWLQRRSEADFVAFSVNCTHLGCPVRWMPEAKLFLCPCHGGVYYADGEVAAGPPPRPLFRYDVRVWNGLVQVKSAPIPIATGL